MELADLSNQRVSALVRQLKEEGFVERTEEKRKAYFSKKVVVNEEVTLYQEGMPLAGVVSTEPGYMLNSELKGGVYVALKGRVPVKIKGSAIKGQYINASKDGYGIASDIKRDCTIGVCLKDGSDIVEVKI